MEPASHGIHHKRLDILDSLAAALLKENQRHITIREVRFSSVIWLGGRNVEEYSGSRGKRQDQLESSVIEERLFLFMG